MAQHANPLDGLTGDELGDVVRDRALSLAFARAAAAAPLARLKRLFGALAMARARLDDRRVAALAGRQAPSAEIPAKTITAKRVTPRAIGCGFADPRQRPGTRRLVVTAEAETFARIRAYAAARGIPFAAAVRALIAAGLAADCASSLSVARTCPPPIHALATGLDPPRATEQGPPRAINQEGSAA